MRKTAKDINDLDALMVRTVQRTTASNRLRPKKQPFNCFISCGCRCSVEVVTLRNEFVTPEPNSNDPSKAVQAIALNSEILTLERGRSMRAELSSRLTSLEFCRELILFCRELIVFYRELILYCFELSLLCSKIVLPTASFLLQYR